jgi:hypothetical protein
VQGLGGDGDGVRQEHVQQGIERQGFEP